MDLPIHLDSVTWQANPDVQSRIDKHMQTSSRTRSKYGLYERPHSCKAAVG